MWRHEDQALLDRAEKAARASERPGRQVGAVIADGSDLLIGTGANHAPAVFHGRMVEAVPKYLVCAEADAIHQAREMINGTSCLYVWPVPPCVACAHLIVAAGLKRVVVPGPYPEHSKAGDRWAARYEYVRQLFDEAGVVLVEAPDKPDI
jgi:deoxycytidylate deaminase|tara:strand:+ start:1795 stop:2244 length:450 start_codon:yes stop_codon:yes gene_type:complete